MTTASPSTLEAAKRRLTRLTHHVYALPVVVLMPHSRCNCRCVMCDIWQANHLRRELGPEDLTPHLDTLRQLGVRRVVLSGGEALMHSNLWSLCRALRELGIQITLLSTGLLLKRHAPNVVAWCDEVIVSLDGSRELHDQIRRVPAAFDRLAEGVAALRALVPTFRVTARCVVQRQNFRDLPNVVATAHALGLNQISFLAADVSSEAFNRPTPWSDERASAIALTRDELPDFERVLNDLIANNAADFAAGFIAENPAKLRRLLAYYSALRGQGEFPPTTCNAPWVSTVVEADGTVRPCFFHRSLGNIHDAPLGEILNSPEAVAFRRNLDVHQDPICRRCVCTLQLGARTPV